MMVTLYHNDTPMIHASIIILVELRKCVCFCMPPFCVCVRAGGCVCVHAHVPVYP